MAPARRRPAHHEARIAAVLEAVAGLVGGRPDHRRPARVDDRARRSLAAPAQHPDVAGRTRRHAQAA